MKRLLGIFFIVLLASCSSSVDTALMTPDEHFAYAKSLFEEEDYEAALLEFQSILLQYSGSQVNDDAQFYLGKTYYERGEYLLGAYEFSKLIRDIPASSYVPDAQFMLAECYYELSPPYQLDQTYTSKAIEEYQAFIDFFPLSPKVEVAESKIKEMNNKLAEKAYYAAIIYDRMDFQKAAVKYYQAVFEKYHDTKFAAMALNRKINLLYERKEYTQALHDISIFLERYPDDENALHLKAIERELTGG